MGTDDTRRASPSPLGRVSDGNWLIVGSAVGSDTGTADVSSPTKSVVGDGWEDALGSAVGSTLGASTSNDIVGSLLGRSA